MSIGGISGSVSSSGRDTEVGVKTVIRPNSYKWTLLQEVQFKNIHVLKVKYEGCTNFEGIKIMVMRDM